jgi:hypothetical protein
MSGHASARSSSSSRAKLLAQERRALDQWAAGHPSGFADVDAEDGTYFDDIGAHRRIDGLAGIRGYLASLEGKIPPGRPHPVLLPPRDRSGHLAGDAPLNRVRPLYRRASFRR